MNTIDYIRWNNALTLIALDLPEQLRQPLWIADFHHDSIRRIRQKMWMIESPVAVLTLLDSALSRIDYATLVAWVSRVFILGGQDRKDEQLWYSVATAAPSFRPASGEETDATDLWELLVRIGADTRLKYLKFSASVDSYVAEDGLRLRGESSNFENIAEQMKLIGALNLFVQAWDSVISTVDESFLTRIHHFGKQQASNMIGGGILPDDVPFPGLWTLTNGYNWLRHTAGQRHEHF